MHIFNILSFLNWFNRTTVKTAWTFSRILKRNHLKTIWAVLFFFLLPVDSLGQWKHAGTQIIKIKESLLAGMYMLLLCCFVCVSVCARVHLFPKAFYDLTLGGHKTNGWIKRKKNQPHIRVTHCWVTCEVHSFRSCLFSSRLRGETVQSSRK